MNEDLEKYEWKKADEKMLFGIAVWGFMLLISPLFNMFSSITEIYKVNLVNVFLNSIFLYSIGLIIFKVSKFFDFKINIFLKIHITITIIIYILTLSFMLINNLFLENNIYFKGKILYLILLISFANIISTILILIIIGNKVRKVKINNDDNSRSVTSIIILFPLILALICTLLFGYIGILFSKPEEIEVTNKNIEYIIRVDGFLVARDEATFIYNKSINLFLMKRLDKYEVPNEILAENNDYYYRN